MIHLFLGVRCRQPRNVSLLRSDIVWNPGRIARHDFVANALWSPSPVEFLFDSVSDYYGMSSYISIVTIFTPLNVLLGQIVTFCWFDGTSLSL